MQALKNKSTLYYLSWSLNKVKFGDIELPKAVCARCYFLKSVLQQLYTYFDLKENFQVK